jgi:long-chain acyl-CoA synthetase
MTVAAILISSAALVFIGAVTKKRFKGTYSVSATDINQEKGQSEVRRHRFSPGADLKHITGSPNVKTLHDVLAVSAERRGDNKACGTRPLIEVVKETTKVNGVDKVWEYPKLGAYNWISYREVLNQVNQFGSGLEKLGLARADRLGLFEETRLEWSVASHGAWRQGLSILTVYANLGEEALVYALNLGEVTTMVLNGKSLGMMVGAASTLTHLRNLIYTDEADAKHLEAAKKAGWTVYSFADFLAFGNQHMVGARPPKPEDYAMIMFTSGTTGMPKGVMLTHEQNIAAIAGAVDVLIAAIGITAERDLYLSYLPLAHILALIVHSAFFYLGVPIGYGSPRSLTDSTVRGCLGDLRELSPTLFVGVPTVYERIKAGVERKLRASPISHFIFRRAYSLKRFLKTWNIPTLLLDTIVFNKLKREMGGRVRAMVSGGAALSAPVIEFMETAFGSRVLQGYGLTETSGPSCVQELTDYRRGSVGPPIPCSRIKLVDVPDMNYLHTANPPRGEIWIGGTNICSGYYKNPEETAKAFVDGWFRTGDVGEWTPEGTLKIIDRIKNLIKPPHGEYVALESIESRYRNCPFVDHVCAYVDGEHNEVVAIVSPNRLMVESWAQKNSIDTSDLGVLYAKPELNAAVLKALQDVARQHKLKSHEMIRAVYLCPDEWTPDNDMLTAAQKLKRNNIVKAYRQQIDTMYAKFAAMNE